MNYRYLFITIFILFFLNTKAQSKDEDLNELFKENLFIATDHFFKDLDSAIHYYNKSLDIGKKMKSLKHQIHAGLNISNCYVEIGEYDKSIQLLNDFDYKLNNNNDSISKILKSYILIGKAEIDFYQLNLKKAKENLLMVVKNTNGSVIKCKAYLHLAAVYFAEKKIDSSEYYYNEALNENNYYFDGILEPYVKIGQVEINNYLGNYEKSKKLIQEIKNLNLKKSNRVNLLKLSIIEHQLVDKHGSKCSALFEARDIILKNYKNNFHLVHELYKELIIHESYLGNYEKVKRLTRELFDFEFFMIEKQKYQITENAKVIYEKKQIMRDLENSELKNELLQSEKDSTILLLAISVLVSLVILSVFYIRYNSIKTRFVTEKYNHIENIKSIFNNQKTKLIESFNEGQKQERKELSRFIHDKIGNELVVFKLKLINGATKEELTPIIDDIAKKMRHLSHYLYENVKDIAFNSLINDLVTNFKGNKKIYYSINPDNINLSLNQELLFDIYLIICEALNNIEKHSNATEVEISLTHIEDKLNLFIEDNGKGIKTTNFKEGIGLRSIRDRVKKSNGKLSIESNKNNGFSISIDFPFSTTK